MPAKGGRQTSRGGSAWLTLFSNTYPNFGDRRNRARSERQQTTLPPQGAQNAEPPPQNVEPPPQNVEPLAQNIEPPIQVEPGSAARAPSPDPATGQNTAEAVPQPAPQGRSRRQNTPRAEQRPPRNDGIPQGHDEVVDPRRPNAHERSDRANNSRARRSRDSNRPETSLEPLFVRRPNIQGHREARRHRERPGPRQQRWAEDIENSSGRARSDARIIVEEDYMVDIAPPARSFAVDWEMANAFFETSSTTSAIDDSRRSETGDTVDEALQLAETNARRNEGPLTSNPDSGNMPEDFRSAHRRSDRNARHVPEPLIAYRNRTHFQEPLSMHSDRRKNKRSGRNDTTEGLRGILKRSGSSHRHPSVSNGNER